MLIDPLIKQDRFRIMRRDDNGVDDNCTRHSAFRRLLMNTIKNNKTFRVMVRLYATDMDNHKLLPRGSMTAPNSLHFQQTGSPVSPVSPSASAPATLSPPPAPNKLEVNEHTELKQFSTKDIHSLSWVQYIHG
jgi:hypothetical protein